MIELLKEINSNFWKFANDNPEEVLVIIAVIIMAILAIFA